MPYTEERLFKIFSKTHGNCHICHGRLVFDRYGQTYAESGGWEVEHSVPRSKGGTDHLNNLYPSHISCNRQKGTKPTRSVRARHGVSRAPYSAAKKERIRLANTLQTGVTAAFIGGLVGGPFGAVAGAILGGAAGSTIKVPK